MRTDEEAQPTPRDRGWTVGFAALLVLPLVVSAVYLWFAVGSAYYPNSDWALFELHTRDVLHHLMFVGPYSRYGWNHPGPLLFYVLAIPYKLLGSRSISMHITALIVNGATIVAIGWVVPGRGRLPMVVATLVPVALLTHAIGADILRNPWNPYLPVIPLLLLLLLCWSVAVGDLWMLPIAIAVASFAIQSHVGFGRGASGCGEGDDAGSGALWTRRACGRGVRGVPAVPGFPVFYGTVASGRQPDKLVGFHVLPPAHRRHHEGISGPKQWGPRPNGSSPRGMGVIGNQ